MEHKELEEFMIHKAQLFFDEGYIFGEGGKGFERLNIACPKHVLEKAMSRLYEALEKQMKER